MKWSNKLKISRSILASLVVIVVILVGCAPAPQGNNPTMDQTTQDQIATSAPTTMQSAAEPESRCDALLTLEEIKTISGLEYSQRDVSGQTLGGIIVTTCTYSTPGASASIKPISILTRSASTIEEAKQIFEQSKTETYTDGQPLSDIGEQALWSPMFGQVSALQGQTWIIVTANNNPELASIIAKEIVDKIK